MKLTVTINKTKNNDSNLRAFANVVFDGRFALENIKIKESSTNKLYVELPRYKRKSGDETEYKDVFHPITTEMHKAFNGVILSSYEQADENKKIFAFEYGKEPLAVDYCTTKLYSVKDDALKGFSNVVFEQGFALENVKVKHSNQSGNLFVELAKYRATAKDEGGNTQVDEKGNTLYVYRDCFHPITKEAYDDLSSAVIEAYETKLGETQFKQVSEPTLDAVPMSEYSDDIGDLSAFVEAEDEYTSMLDLTAEEDKSRK